MGMISEFKEFAMKGNLVDMAVGFVMGSAFATVVSSFIDGVFMPLISPVLGGIDLSKLTYVMEEPTIGADGTVIDPGVIVAFGGFLTALISFLIVAFVMYMIIKGMNKAMPEEEPAPEGPSQEDLLKDIRDLMAAQNAKM